MAQALPSTSYVFDPADPRAPTSEQWSRMTPAERAHVADMLPADVPLELMPPEGDAHRKAKRDALDALDGFFRRIGRKIYLSSELAVFYPGEPRFAPDVLAVLNVEPHERMKWVVDVEGKGLDFVLEVHVAGNRAKDHEDNVERYARLGVREYFLFDRSRLRLHAYRLPAAQEGDPSRPRVYQRIVPQAGRFASEVLGLDLLLDGSRLRFFAGNAPLEDADERIARLGGMLDQVIARQEEAQRLAEELAAELDREQRLREEEQRLREQEQRLREEAERQLAQARAEIERLKGR
ncbi:Uma2 family endonuclease [Sorangium sp. So ce341]|uniref:Uma2 family endonuclease n=1 Tax=Sorangium sp. So ce341 TaxID=3133302 RepID=UPI003F636718